MKKKVIVLMLAACSSMILLVSGCGDVGTSPVISNDTSQVAPKEHEMEEVKNNNDDIGTVTENTTQDKEKGNKEEVVKEEKFVKGDVKLVADNPIIYNFFNGSVHDPSIVEDNGVFYVFGSHLAVAKTTDFMNWTMVGSGVNSTNPVIENVREEMKEAFEWAKTDTFWAPDVIQLADGKFYMYYCTCEGSSPLASLGVAVADKVEGPYKDLGIFLKSGMASSIKSEDGNTYNANIHPNVIDPSLYYDKDGRLFMMYGSYSGGIYVLELDVNTGFPINPGYGKKVLGGNHVRIEAPYVIYSEETEYYYMFLTFGGLDSVGGYNMRVVRSKNPDGPFYDSEGTDMIECKGPSGTFFHDKSIEPYGAKIMGNFRFAWEEGEQSKIRTGYVSPGHNSVYYDKEAKEYFLIFHTRFEAKGESHEIRVHQMYLNKDGWFVVSPYRYVGGATYEGKTEDVAGYYKYINHGKGITKDVVISELILLNEDGTISGAVEGTWNLEDSDIQLVIGETSYTGRSNVEWDEFGKKNVMTFSAMSETGVSIWGSGLEALE